jgi:hypothetical protein
MKEMTHAMKVFMLNGKFSEESEFVSSSPEGLKKKIFFFR